MSVSVNMKNYYTTAVDRLTCLASAYDDVVEHLNAGDKNAVLVSTSMGGSKSPILTAKDLPNIKKDGNGIRFKMGKKSIFAFGSQLRFGTLK